MTDLRLEVGESILLQTDDAGLYDGNNETNIDELYLTNKNIIYVHEKSIGIFKFETVVDKIPLSSIAVVNGIVQIQQVDDEDYGKALQIIYTSGKRELLELNVSPNKQYPVWKAAISDAVVRLTAGVPEPQVVTTPPSAPVIPVEPTAPAVKEEKDGKAFAGAALFAGFKGVVDAAKQTFAEVSQTVTEKVVQPVENSQVVVEPEPVAEVQPTNDAGEKKESKVMFCSNCGTKLNEGAKFCHGCGSAVGTVTPTAPPVVEQPAQPKPQERQQEYVGTVLKCPNCGAVISATTAVCPDCGMHISGRSAVGSVQAFKDQLMQIENSRVGGWGGYLLSSSTLVDPADKKKLTLITNFPIPNSVEDIVEFILLAITNINVGLSKGKWDKRPPSQETGYTIKRTLSNAWVAKMIQAYQKAEILFPNDPAFAKIQKIYLEKAAELKIKIK